MDYTVHGILQARLLEWVAFPFSRGSSQRRDRAQLSHIAGEFFTSWATREGASIKCQWSSCSYRKCPQGGSTSSCWSLVPPVTRALGKVSFLRCKLEWNVPERTPKGLCLTTSSPWSFTSVLHTHPYQGHHSCWSAYEAARSGRKLWSGTPVPADLDSWWLYPGPRGQRLGSQLLGCIRDSGPSQEPDSTSLRGVSMWGTLLGCVHPTPVQPWGSSLFRFQVSDSI